MSDLYILVGKEPKQEPDVTVWGRWYGEADRTVAKTDVGDMTVSTVFLGLDHSFDGGRPVLFETLVFGGQLSDEGKRYCTWDEAETGHAAMVERARALMN